MSIATVLTFIVYIMGMLAIGLVMYYRTSDLSDYVLGGRSLGPAVAALSAGASDMSGWLLLGLPGAIYTAGFSEAWMGVGLSIGAYLNWQFVAKRLRVYTEVASDSITIPDFLSNRFKDESHLLRVISAIVILIFFLFYTSSGMVAGAKLFEASFGLPYQAALWLGALVIVGYTLLGGFLAVSWTDFIQGTLMFLALIIIPIVAISKMGGWSESIQAVGEIESSNLNMVSGVSVMAIISAAAWGLGYFGQPHIIVRFMAMRNPKDVPIARFVGTSWMVIGLYGAIFTGLIGLAYVSTADPAALADIGAKVTEENGMQVLEDPEKIFIVFSQILFHPVVAGILLAGILSAIMSTIDSQLLVSSSAVAEDIYRALFKKEASGKELVWVGRIATLAIAIIAAAIATDPDSQVLELVEYAWAGFGASFGPTIVLALFWRRITRNGALAGIIAGALTVIIWGDFLSGGIFELYEIVPGFFLNLIITMIVSLMGRPTKEMEEEYDATMEKLKEY